MEDSIRIQIFEELPTSKEFESLIEPRNVPAVFKGCIKGWEAFSKWNPSSGGLDYLQGRIGSCKVEAMVSRSAPVFYGDLGSHERVPLPFSTFIAFCKKRMTNKDQGIDASFWPRSKIVGSDKECDYLPLEEIPEQIYLAQVPVMNRDNEDRVQLETLREDIQMPPFLEAKNPSSINLWMNNAHARSSTHYDPHHNLLCIVYGCKQVVLWPPSASPSLYPMPIYGEASNHSSVALENPDYSNFPEAECSMELAQKVFLGAGDALFIPEGWFHQNIEKIDRQRNGQDHLLHKSGMGKSSYKLPDSGQAECGGDSYNQMLRGVNSKEKKLQCGDTLLELEPAAVQVLHELVSLVHNCVSIVNQDEQLQSASTSTSDSALGVNGECEKTVATGLKDDLVAKILWGVEPCIFQNVFLAMAQKFPRTLEAFVLHVLSPVGAEVLTRKFDEMDKQILEEDRNRFYEIFYSAFDDHSAAMNSILKGKEAFARQAFKNVLDKYVGVNLETSEPRVR